MQPGPSHVNDAKAIDATGRDDKDNLQSAALSPQTTELPKRAPFVKRLWAPVLLLMLIAAGVLLWVRQDELLDWAYLRNYQPPADVQNIARQATFTPYAQRLFYVNRPALEDKSAFNANCPDASEEVAVLGCYRGDRLGIHVYRVNDERLDGIIQVTAAHEMLHQAYDRLSGKERRRIDTELQKYAATITDKALQEKIDAYKEFEASEINNEMHSIFGTEVAKLSPSLEEYYKQYFVNRSQVVAYHGQYKAAFTERQNQIEAYDAQLVALGKDIEADKKLLDNMESALQSQRSQMDSWLRSEQVDRYNAAVPGFNAAVETYRKHVAATNDRINRYNNILDKRNKIAVQEQELLKAQDSQASSADAQ